MEDLGENGRIVVSNEKTGHILDSSNSIDRQAERYFEHGKKKSIFRKHEIFLRLISVTMSGI